MSDSRPGNIKYFATCARGLEEILAVELNSPKIQASNVLVGSSGVWFEGDRATGYRANLWLRTAVRVLAEQSRRRIHNADMLHTWVRNLPWEEIMTVRDTISVDCRVWDSNITHSKFAALRVKDGICDRWRDRVGERPSVDVDKATLPLFLYVFKNEAVLYRDLSGMTLHKRGYRGAMHRSSLNESVAAGILLLGGWDGSGHFLDPMCGSGTFALEAASIALGRAPGLARKRSFPFESWPDFDKQLWADLRAEAKDSARHELSCRILASDRHPGAVALAQQDASRASLDRYVEIEQADVETYVPPVAPAFVFTNPPWGERLKEEGGDESEPWRQLGRFLKRACPGAKAHVLSGNAELTRFLGMKSTQRWPIRVGKFDCRAVRYEVREERPAHAREQEAQEDQPR